MESCDGKKNQTKTSARHEKLVSGSTRNKHKMKSSRKSMDRKTNNIEKSIEVLI